MIARQDKNDRTIRKHEVKELIERRLVELRPTRRISDEQEEAFLACQEAILREVLRRAQSCQESSALLALVDHCIKESHLYERHTTDRGLKSFYKFRIKVLRRMMLFMRRYLSLRRWPRPARARS